MKKMLFLVLCSLFLSINLYAAEPVQVTYLGPNNTSGLLKRDYQINLSPLAAHGNIADLNFYSNCNDGWNGQDLTINPTTGILEVVISTLNTECDFDIYTKTGTAGNWYELNTTGFSTVYWNPATSKGRIGFADGNIYTMGQMPSDPYPTNSIGDDHVRYIANLDNSLTVFFKLSYQWAGLYDNQFLTGNINNWQTSALTPQDSWGWSAVTYNNIPFPYTLNVAAGGHWDSVAANRNWIDPTGSIYYDAANGYLTIPNIGQANGLTAIKITGIGQLPDLRHQYRVEAHPMFFGTTPSAPGLISDHNGAVSIPMVLNQSGMYEATIESYNRETTIGVHGDAARTTWLDGSKTPYWNTATGTMIIGLHDGTVFAQGQMPIDQFPLSDTTLGDDHVRWQFSEPNLSVWLKVNSVNGATDAPFVQSSIDYFQNQAATPVNTWGWVLRTYSLPGGLNSNIVKINGGGHLGSSAATSTWVNLVNSAFYTENDSQITLGEKITITKPYVVRNFTLRL